MAKDLLLEIGTEEIPAKFMPGALAQLEAIAKTQIFEQRIAYSEIKVFGTPRRLVLLVRDLAEQQDDKLTENKGPSIKIAYDENGAPTKAAQGFARGQGIDVAQLAVKEGYVYAVVQEKGRQVVTLLPALLTDIITALNFPKNMRWADLDVRFARPIRWLLALFGGEVVPFTYAAVNSDRLTYGHRFLSKGPLIIESVNDYFTKLAENHVMVDQNIRRQVISEQIKRLAVNHGGNANIDEGLLEEVTYLVEYPTALCGTFETKYLELPKEAIITPMREHQRYFPVFGENGQLLPVFITVRNGGQDYIDIVRHGNERVLKARLADARFFFEEDKKINLADRVEKLKTIVFQEGLGTVYDKTIRLQKLAVFIARQAQLPEDVIPIIERAAYLAKADLVTGMVCEFTELQGVMGREYALLNNEGESVAQAIFEHYLPRFAGDELPLSHVGRVVSIADKIDNIVATFSRGIIPTGSQDPYALRRQALGIVNMLIDAKYNLSTAKIIDFSMELLNISDLKPRQQLHSDIQEFFKLRLKNVFLDEHMRHDMIEAVISNGIDDIYDTWLRARVLARESSSPAFYSAVQAFTRAGNLAKNAPHSEIKPELFAADAERVLYEAYDKARTNINDMLIERDYAGILAEFAKLAGPIDFFFSNIMIMVEDNSVRNNRLALLKSIAGLTGRIADLSKITL